MCYEHILQYLHKGIRGKPNIFWPVLAPPKITPFDMFESQCAEITHYSISNESIMGSVVDKLKVICAYMFIHFIFCLLFFILLDYI